MRNDQKLGNLALFMNIFSQVPKTEQLEDNSKTDNVIRAKQQFIKNYQKILELILPDY